MLPHVTDSDGVKDTSFKTKDFKIVLEDSNTGTEN